MKRLISGCDPDLMTLYHWNMFSEQDDALMEILTNSWENIKKDSALCKEFPQYIHYFKEAYDWYNEKYQNSKK